MLETVNIEISLAKRKAKYVALAADEACQDVAPSHPAPLFTSCVHMQDMNRLSQFFRLFITANVPPSISPLTCQSLNRLLLASYIFGIIFVAVPLSYREVQ